jgi:hypothetical protein
MSSEDLLDTRVGGGQAAFRGCSEPTTAAKFGK